MGDQLVSQWLRGAGGQALTASSCRMCSMVASSARVPLVASSSTALTVFKSDVTLVTITCRRQPESCSRTGRPSPVSLAWCSTSPPPKHKDPQAGTVLRLSGCWPDLGRILQLVHGRIVPRLAGSGFGGTDQVSQGFSDVLDSVDQDHLGAERRAA